MTNLMNLQHQFQNYLLENQCDIQKSIVNTAELSINQRLNIYFDAYHYRLIDCLASNFPILMTYLGPEKFHQLSREYIHVIPSSYRSIRWYGDSFAAYLKINEKPYVAEFAEFEWKLSLSFDAQDAEILSIEEMAAIPAESWAKVSFLPHPSLQRMNFSWNIVEIWQALTDEQVPNQLEIYSAPKPWIIWRRDYFNHFFSLEDDEAWALDALINGATFSELCEGLNQWFKEEDIAMRAAYLLKKWIQSGLLTELKIVIDEIN